MIAGAKVANSTVKTSSFLSVPYDSVTFRTLRVDWAVSVH